MRQPISQQLHNSVVSIRARELLGEGNYVWADVGGYLQPQLVFGFIPDIIAVNGSRRLISEVETSETYSSHHTLKQLSAFDSAGNCSLEVVVPEAVYDAARKLYLVIWRITVDFWRIFRD